MSLTFLCLCIKPPTVPPRREKKKKYNVKQKVSQNKSINPAQHLLHNINITTVKILYLNRHICELQI